jgi:hypothetical protein
VEVWLVALALLLWSGTLAPQPPTASAATTSIAVRMV